jgi:Ni,Fe-hydrogenase III small subunit
VSALDFLRVRLAQGTRTAAFPPESNVFPERFRGRPVFDAGKCVDGCRECVARVPSSVLRVGASGSVEVDAGASLFSPDEAAACPVGALAFSNDYRIASTTREGLVSQDGAVALAKALGGASRRLFGRALRLRQVSAGGCNGCEAELVALGNVVFDLARFGVQFVASPRHADGLVITGTVNANMQGPLRNAWEATPEPRIVVAVGACAINGGPFLGSAEAGAGVPADIPVDLWVPGCPPHPLTVMDGLLRLLGRVEAGER